MKKLAVIHATGEQLPIISQNRLGVEVICGAAGSGKTSTALLRLRSLCYMYLARHERVGNKSPVKILVLTFNRTLSGYVSALAQSQIDRGLNVEVEISTFAKWAIEKLGRPRVVEDATDRLRPLVASIGNLTEKYAISEVDYAMGRFTPGNLEEYLNSERTGRGNQPRVDKNLRKKLLDEVIKPYQKALTDSEQLDWNLLAVSMAQEIDPIGYEVVIVDESQDFSANQLRAIKKHLAPEHTVTFVIDTVQRIYARGFTWIEAGFDVRPERSHRLEVNHRNTAQIAALAAGILNGINVEGEGALPNLKTTKTAGALPVVLAGYYRDQINWAVNFIKQNIDLTQESVAFLKPLGGKWFAYMKQHLNDSRIPFVEITRESEWPEGTENVALSTFHSAKGLEFDYVFILGLSHESTPHGDEEHDDQLLVLRRLLAVAVARARKHVVIGYKPGEESNLMQFFPVGTFTAINV
ncbi:3'-5' exonuclease [Paenacidovorax monticola]|uniref:DNA 3'-5' helicase n=1 Tax=Paenacidovorax monticola TaxID=1926868 RepID=A0A7H0HKT0_9BURK|nr:3'-5' exonuclease [Paenacidovorax monticola]QNP61146.1 DEAD/DEAH box helicase [Paenacidovorax monticola]